MAATRITALTATAAALLAVGAGAASAAPGPVTLTHDVPAFTQGPVGSVAWTESTFTPLSIGRGYELQVTDLSGSDDSVHVTAANDRTQIVTLVNGHRYNLRVRAFERICIAPIGGGCLAHAPVPVYSAFSPDRFTRADLQAPVGGVSINDGANFTNSRDLTLHLNYIDHPSAGFPPSGVSGVQINQAGVAFPAPVAVAATRPYTLDEGPDGPRQVRVRYRDAAVPLTPNPGGGVTGNVSAIATDTIVLDRLAPTAVVTQSATSVETGVAVSFASASSVDGAGGPADSGIDPATVTWSFGDGTTAIGPSLDKTYSTPGVYAGTLTVRDRAGNEASAPFAVNVTGPPVAQPPSIVITGDDLILGARRVNRAVQGRQVRFQVVVTRRTRVTAGLFRKARNGRLVLVRRNGTVGGPGKVVVTLRSPRAGTYEVRLRAGAEVVELPVRVARR